MKKTMNEEIEMNIELKACPFCGANAAELTNAHDLEECANFEDENCFCEQYENCGACGYHTVVCNANNGGCGAASGYFFREELAILAWNRRT